MDDKDYFLKMIIRIFDNGIYLGELESPEEYMEGLIDIFANEKDLYCRIEHKTVVIEDSMCVPIMNLAISNNTLFVVPAGEDNFFSCFMKVIRHVSKVHRQNKTKKKNIEENSFEWI